MNPLPDAARWHRLDAALCELLDLDADARAQWIAQHCENQPDLAAELRRLVAYADEAGPLERIGRTAWLADALDALPGANASIGGWRLVRRIGAGGMAEVFLAERDSGGVRQRAALKLMASGLGSPEMRQRFLRERAILARLSDARIARYLDGGIADDGRPWLATEYIAGAPIDRYCREHRLALRERIALFRDVCGAVAHAHRHLVVHRDIKPSNVLVSDEGQVNLLDFGIAKPLDEDGGDATRTTMRLMTPHYASPEQLNGDAASTVTDVFLLGLLLYELIAGERPFASCENDRRALEHALCELDPPPPSEALKRHRADAAAPPVSPRAVRGDLDRIVLTALRKEPEHRYPSAEALDRDLAAWLAGEPISARRASLGYRAGKLVARHRLASAAIAGAVVVALGYTGLLVQQNAAFRKQRDLARSEAAKSSAIKDFMIELFDEADPAKNEGEKLSIGKVLDAGGARIATAFADQPRVRAEMLHTLGRVYHALGSTERARTLLVQAIALRRGLPDGSADLAGSLTELAAVERDDSHVDRAVALAREAVGVAGSDPRALAPALHGLGLALSMRDTGDYGEATAALDRAIDLYRRASPRDALQIARAESDRAGLYMHLGRTDEAETGFRDALAVMAPQLGERNPDVTAVRYNLARLEEQLGKFDLAARDFTRVIAAETAVFGADSVDVAIDRTRLAYVDRERGRYEDAAAGFAAALATMRAKLPASHKRIAENLMGDAETLVDLGRTDEASAKIAEALAILEQHFDAGDWRIAEAHRIQARAWNAAGRHDDALRLLHEAGPILIREPAPYPARYRATLATVESHR